MPSAVIASGQCEYPEGILEAIQDKFETVALNAGQIAIDLGSAKCMNVVLFGALVKALKMDEIDWENVIENIGPRTSV